MNPRETAVGASLSILALSVALSLMAFTRYFPRLSDCPLASFPDRAIGVAVVYGMDVPQRTLVYVGTLAAFMFACGGAYLLLSRLAIRTFWARPGSGVRMEQSIVGTLSAFVSATTIFAMIRQDPALEQAVWYLWVGLGLMGLLILQRVLYARWGLLSGGRDRYAVVAAGLGVVYGLTFALRLWSGGPLVFTSRDVAIGLAAVILLAGAYPFIVAPASVTRARLARAMVMAGMPLVFIPFLIPLVNELQFTLSGTMDVKPQSLAAGMAGFLVAASIVVLLASYRTRRPRWRTAAVVAYVYFPVVLAGLYLYGSHRHGLELSGPFDLNHLAEPTVPTQQLLRFGALPFVDILPTHGASDFLSAVLYSLVNGYRGLEMLLWDWAGGLVHFVLLYFVIARLITPLFGLCALLCLPAEMILGNTYGMALLPCLLLFWVARRPRFARYLLLWAAVLWVFCWRYDVGLAALVACLVTAPGVYVCHRGRLDRAAAWWFLASPAAALLCASLTALGVFSLAITLRGRSVADVLEQFLLWFRIFISTHSYVSFCPGFSSLVVWQYAILPMAPAAYLVYLGARMCTRNVRLSRAQVVLACLAAFSLVMSVRGLHRHSLMEGYNPYAGVFLLATAWLFFARSRTLATQYAFLGVVTLHCLVFHNTVLLSSAPDGFGLVFQRTTPSSLPVGLSPLLKKDPLFEFRHWQGRPPRVAVANQGEYTQLADFFNRTMDQNQTFLDFTSAPMLYALTERRCPAYYHQVISYTTEAVQTHLLQRLTPWVRAQGIPYVIFKRGEPGWEALDTIPQELRSYRIAEFIYRNYAPFAMVGRYVIWKQQDWTPLRSVACAPRAGRTDGLESPDAPDSPAGAVVVPLAAGPDEPRDPNTVDLGRGICLNAGEQYGLKIRYSSSRPGTLGIRYDEGEGAASVSGETFCSVRAGEAQAECVAIIPKHREASLRRVRLQPPPGARFTAHEITILPLGMIPITAPCPCPPQAFDFGRLAYLWGTYDEREAARRTAVLAALQTPATSLPANQPWTLRLPPDIGKASGNYLHLRIRSLQDGRVALHYGASGKDLILFDVVGSEKVEDYLVRISVQWAWMSQSIQSIQVTASVPVEIHEAVVRAGD